MQMRVMILSNTANQLAAALRLCLPAFKGRAMARLNDWRIADSTARESEAELKQAKEWEELLAAFEAQAAMSPKQTSGTSETVLRVVVDHERIKIKRGVQTFELAYEAETDDERQWYAKQLRSALAAPVAQAEPLTDEQCGAIWRKHCGGVPGQSTFEAMREAVAASSRKDDK